VYASRLRSKLEPLGIHLRAVRGFGYRLEEEATKPNSETTAAAQ
jgi:DNA-binding response OmpR family regulator